MYENMVAITNHTLCPYPEGMEQENKNFFEPGTVYWQAYLNQIRRIVSVKPKAVVLREKDLDPGLYMKLAYEVGEICREQNQKLIFNTSPAVAAELGAKKLHLSMGLLRSEGRPSYAEWVGTSIHSLEEVKEAAELGADYLFAGNIYETDCKRGLPGKGLEFLRQICMESRIPVYAIGGITEKRLPQILEAGAAGGCMMSGFMRLQKKDEGNEAGFLFSECHRS